MFDKYDIIASGGVSKRTISLAKKELNFSFPDDFKKYLGKYGTVRKDGNDLFGLGIQGHRNIIQATKKERQLSSSFPPDCIVICNLGIDGILILLGEDGAIYQYMPKEIKRIYNSFTEWVVREFVNY